MQYAILGDIHSSKEDLEAVLNDISVKAPTATCVGTGDLYECIISKKDISDKKFNFLEEVMLIPEGFTELLTFPSKPPAFTQPFHPNRDAKIEKFLPHS